MLTEGPYKDYCAIKLCVCVCVTFIRDKVFSRIIRSDKVFVFVFLNKYKTK